MISIGVKKLHPAAILPKYSHEGEFGDLAADLYSVEEVTFHTGDVRAIPIGIALEFPPGYGALVADRSGLAMKGLTTFAGVIDPGYRGELKVVAGLGNKLRAAMAHIAPDAALAQMHRGMAEPGSGVEKPTKSKEERTDRPRPAPSPES